MGLPEIINNIFHLNTFHTDFILEGSLLQNISEMQKIYNIGYEKALIHTDFILFEPHIVTLSICLGLWFLDYLFDALFWDEYIRPLRTKVKTKIMEWLKYLKTYLLTNLQ